MADYFFDTSALVKRHVNEVGSDYVRTLTRPKAAHSIYISRITAVEVYAAISSRQRGGSLTLPQAAAMLGHFRRHLDQRYYVIELSPDLLTEAMFAARKHGLRAYDAVQLTVALDPTRLLLDDGFPPLTLVSADKPLNAAAVAEGLTVEDPATHP